MPKTATRTKLSSDAVAAWAARLRPAALAFAPACLMPAVIHYVNIYEAPLPGLWLVPAVLYLLTTLVVFLPQATPAHELIIRLMPLVVLMLVLILLSEASEPFWLLILLHWIGLFLIGLTCHGELGRSRRALAGAAADPIAERSAFPKDAKDLLLLAAGGAAGGLLFGALLAPLLFQKVGLAEYPLALVLACLTQRTLQQQEIERPFTPSVLLRHDLAPAAVLLAVTLLFVFASRLFTLPSGPIRAGIVFALPAVVAYALVDRPLRYALCLAALFLAAVFYEREFGRVQYLHRNFTDLHRVALDASEMMRWLRGTVVHGQQGHGPLRRYRDEPLAYYHAEGPIGGLFRAWRQPEYGPRDPVSVFGIAAAPGGALTAAAVLAHERTLDMPPLKNVAVVGLGVGTLAAYARASQNWTFFADDPVERAIAEGQFTYLKDSKVTPEVRIGDPRQTLAGGKGKFDLIIVDAYTSNRVPVELLTREALELYLSRLSDTGVLAFHITNPNFELTPVLAALADDAKLTGYVFDYPFTDAEERKRGYFNSQWVFLGRKDSAIEPLRRRNLLWSPMPVPDPAFLWTDDSANVYAAFRTERLPFAARDTSSP